MQRACRSAAFRWLLAFRWLSPVLHCHKFDMKKRNLVFPFLCLVSVSFNMVLINKLHSAHVKIAKNEAENAELKVASARTLLLIRYVMSCTNIGENDPDTSGIRAGQGCSV